MFPVYHESLDDLHVGCEKPRSYFIPFSDRASALSFDREKSDLFFNLSGEWNFRFYESFRDVGEAFLDRDFNDTLKVPSCWQLSFGKGYDAPLYSNLRYPFPLDPPYVPDEIPCGHYNRTFNLPSSFDEKVYIDFEGVSSCFYLFINKRFAGYSQVSHCTSEFDVTDLVRPGANRIDVLVLKWCDGSYLEDQDFFRLSGIFREVYLLGRKKDHLVDFFFDYTVSDDLRSVDIALRTSGGDGCVFTLIDPYGVTVHRGRDGSFSINRPVLWNAEQPRLYTLIIECCGEFIAEKVGFKRIDIRDGKFFLNGRTVRLWGINRHDSDPFGGYTVSLDDMKRDLCQLKRANVNCIRTSHYPNDPRFLGLCDEWGFMVVDEADIETHGMGFEYRDTWDWTRWSKLSTDDEWEKAYVDRAERLFERDKNHPCVIMWSLGNESGCGKNHRAMRKYIKSRDPKAIVHYENSHLEFKAVPEGECFKDISDVESRMYSSLEYTEDYLRGGHDKPFFFCEYCCDNSTGNVLAHTRLADKYDNLMGLCMWEMTDHAVAVRTDRGTAYRYGGDFGDYPNDRDCCVDGIITPAKTERPNYYDIKYAYQPFKITFSGDTLTVFNKRYFTDLNDLSLSWRVESDGETVACGEIDDLSVLPREEKSYRLSLAPEFHYGDCYLTVFAKQKRGSFWCEAGYETGFEQFRLPGKPREEEDKPFLPLSVAKRGRYYSVLAEKTAYVFDSALGRLEGILRSGRDHLASPLALDIWLAHPRNLRDLKEERQSCEMHNARQKTYSFDIRNTDRGVEITVPMSLGGPSVQPVVRGTIRYTVLNTGELMVNFKGAKTPLAPALPKIGFTFKMPAGYDNVEYFGKGPGEAYADRLSAARIGAFSEKVDEHFPGFVRPKECGAHAMTRRAKITDRYGRGLELRTEEENGFYFKASHFTAGMLEAAAHSDELVPLEETVVCFDRHIEPFGGHGVFDELEPQRVYDYGDMDFTFTISPVR